MGTLCIVGGVTGYARTRSIPSLVAGVGYVSSNRLNWDYPQPHSSHSVGALYLYSGDSIRKHTANGLETALGEQVYLLHLPDQCECVFSLGASALLLLSSLPRITKGPIPVLLTVTSAASGAYYGNTIYNLRQN